ncbi:MAG: AAA family ATPase [Fibrobacter sp.]|nr:AAA family ATPase [Fibrobacter sp.]
MIYDELIAKLSELPVNTEYPYVPSSTSSEQNKYKLLSVSFDNIKVERDGSEVSVSIQQIKTILENLRENKPLDIEKILGSSGNTRSIIESLLCLTPSIFYTKINRRKHIILLSELTHNLGSLTGIDENELSSIVAGEIQRHRIQMEAEFKNFLTSITKSKRTKRPLEPSAISSYLRFIKIDKLFDYDPSTWQHIESIYDIESVDEIVAIIKKLHENDVFVQRNLNDNKGWRAGSINQYRDFLIYKNQNISSVGELDDEPEESSGDGNMKCKQKIFFGAPGTGKSHTIKSEYLVDVSEDNIFRTTFHPDYDYAQFVGSYKPIQKNVDFHGISFEKLQDEYKRFEKDEFGYPLIRLGLKYCKSDILKDTAKRNDLIESVRPTNKKVGDADSVATGLTLGNFFCDELAKSEISYQFVPQVFAKAVKAAFDNPEKQIYLVIEEINRGNCAQIFGDIFQLLDRDENGESRYSINLDSDFAAWLGQDTLRLPANFNILATMNTSDQSLFPMDSAFKRRFDWEYVPIDYKQAKANFFIEIGNEKYSWLDFLEKVNENIFEVTDSEDKQMGEFFVKPKNDKKIDLDMFLSKVMFYLWDSVYKDEPDRKKIFHFDWEFEKDKKLRVTFQRLFKDRDTTIKILQHMMDENLKVLKYTQQ